MPESPSRSKSVQHIEATEATTGPERVAHTVPGETLVFNGPVLGEDYN